MNWLEVGGGRLAYWDSGSGTPLVFIHGVATSGELWPMIYRSCARFRALLPHARVVSLDTAGHYITIDARDELLAILRDSAPAAV